MPTEVLFGSVAAVFVPFVILVVGISVLVRNLPTKLVLLGVLAGAAAVAYGGLVPTAVLVAERFMKIAILLVLGGLGLAALSYVTRPDAARGAGVSDGV